MVIIEIIMDSSSVAILRLGCPACESCVEVPLLSGERLATCPNCAASVTVPEVVGLPPVATKEAQTRRDLKVRTPAMPGSRLGKEGSKEPPRLPKPGEAAAAEPPAPILIANQSQHPAPARQFRRDELGRQ